MIERNGVAVSEYIESIIIGYYNGEKLTNKRAEEFKNFLKNSKNQGLTISCPCFALSIGNRNGVFYLRKPSNKDHLESCSLKNKVRAERDTPDRPREPTDLEIDLMTGTGDVAGAKRSGQSGGNGTPRKKKTSRFLSALMYLFDKAGTNLNLEKKSGYDETRKRFEEVAKTIFVSESLDIKLSSVLSIESKYDRKTILKKLSKAPEQWPKGSTYHQVVVLACDEIERDDECLTLFTRRGEIRERIGIFKKGQFKHKKIKIKTIGNQSINKGPFVIAFLVTLGSFKNKENKTINYPRIEQCVYHYINNKTEMCLVESTYERQMLWALRKHFGENLRLSYRLDKPIYNVGESRPDFILAIEDSSFSIEVAGLDSEEYRASKINMHRKMTHDTGTVLEFDATNMNNPFFEMISWVEANFPPK